MGTSGRRQGDRVRPATRARVLAAAEDLFLSHGFTATSVDAVAHRAGYTTGAVYSNFGGKADLFLAVLEEGSSTKLAEISDALDAATTDEQRLEVFGAGITSDPARWQARAAATIEFLAYARRHPELHERVRAAQALADETVGELIAGLCRALGVEPPTDRTEITREVQALINGLVIRSLVDDDLDLGPAVSRGINALLTGEHGALVAASPSRTKPRQRRARATG